MNFLYHYVGIVAQELKCINVGMIPMGIKIKLMRFNEYDVYPIYPVSLILSSQLQPSSQVVSFVQVFQLKLYIFHIPFILIITPISSPLNLIQTVIFGRQQLINNGTPRWAVFSILFLSLRSVCSCQHTSLNTLILCGFPLG